MSKLDSGDINVIFKAVTVLGLGAITLVQPETAVLTLPIIYEVLTGKKKES